MKSKVTQIRHCKLAALTFLILSALVILYSVDHIKGENNMDRNILRKLPVAVAGLLATSTGVAASDMDSRVSMLENQMKQVGTENAFDGFGANTATARPSKEEYNWFITGDVLYWKPFVGGTEFAFTDTGTSISYPVKGRTKDMSWSWNGGLRAGIGYNFCFDSWDLYANYTHIDFGDSKSVSGSCGASIVVPLRGGLCPPGADGGIFTATRAKSFFNFDFDSIDIQLGRNYFVSAKLSTRPFFGAKTAWIDLEQKTRFCGGNPANDTTFCGNPTSALGPNTYKIRENSDFWGLGPELGVNTKWFLAKGFSFFFDTTGALLYGYFDVDHKESHSLVGDRKIKLSGNVHKMVPTVQMTGGVAYDLFFDDDKMHIGFSFGYDGQYWWRANQMLKIDDTGPLKYERWSEDLSMHGLTLRGRWDF